MQLHRGSVLIAAALIVASACTTEPTASPSPTTAATTNGTPSIKSSRCTGQGAEQLLRAFVADFNAGKNDLASAYFAGPDRFVRWWDRTLPPGITIEHKELGSHLRKLQSDGVRLPTVEHFRDAGFQGAGQPDEGGWFNFGLPSPTAGNSSRLFGKGAVDCVSNKFIALVISW